MTVLHAKDIERIACAMEENGEKFYRAWAAKTADSNINKILLELADEEKKHMETFRTFFSDISPLSVIEEEAGAYMNFFNSYTENLVFKTSAAEIPEDRLRISVSVLEYAVAKEYDSIAYYNEIKNFVRADNQHIISRVIDEERTHIVKLVDIIQTL